MKKDNNKYPAGFTIIELLVVVAIIAILAGLAVVGYQYAITRARYGTAREDLNKIRKAVIIARQNSGKILSEITGSKCSDCSCATGIDSGIDMRGISEGDPCFDNAQAALDAIEQASGITNLPRIDPWNSPYTLDENEGDNGWGDCRWDYIKTAGPDGVIRGSGDNCVIRIPNYITERFCETCTEGSPDSQGNCPPLSSFLRVNVNSI